jgi:hypothetical protein
MLTAIWRLVKRAIARFLAARIIVAAAWTARRYAAIASLLLLLFIGFWLIARQLGPWADLAGRALGLLTPALFTIAAVIAFAWATTARAIEPAKPGETLEWPEEEREPDPEPEPEKPTDAGVYELYPDREDEPA